MSRVGKLAVTIPAGVEVTMKDDQISVKAASNVLHLRCNSLVNMVNDSGKLNFTPANESREANAMTGTMRQLVNNMVVGVTQGFEKKLTLLGVGYKAQAQGANLNLELGYSHPINHKMPAGVTVETPSQTEIVLKCADKQVLGQVAAQIRAYRAPEPYKGKGVRYADEVVVIKETKKK